MNEVVFKTAVGDMTANRADDAMTGMHPGATVTLDFPARGLHLLPAHRGGAVPGLRNRTT